MAAKQIGFSLIGDAIPLGTFIDAAQDLKALLFELDTAVSGTRNLEWTILELRTGSATVTVTPSLLSEEAIDESTAVISIALTGMEIIEKTAERPPYFTDTALLKAKELVSLLNGRIERIAVFGNSGRGETKRVRITQRVAANVDQLLGTNTIALGSIEGTLETVTIHGGTTFNVYDLITRRGVRCLCDRETLDQLSSHLGQRVLIEGEVRYNIRGQPISVKVKRHRFLKDSSQLPQAKDIRGLFAKDKIDLEEWSEYVRS